MEKKPLSKERRELIERFRDLLGSSLGQDYDIHSAKDKGDGLIFLFLSELLADSAFWRNAVQKECWIESGGQVYCFYCDVTQRDERSPHYEPHKPDCPWTLAQD